MKTKPMLCKGSVVRAMMDGRQTQDRRPIKTQPYRHNRFALERIGIEVGAVESFHANGLWEDKNITMAPYQVGDIVWVRESWRVSSVGDCLADPSKSWWGVDYKAGGGINGKGPLPGNWSPKKSHRKDGDLAWSPSIHMPKWACRLFLKVNAVRVERIRDISEDDAIAEGIDREHDGNQWWYYGDPYRLEGSGDPRHAFSSVWESIYPGSWERNEWVWVISFSKTEKPADWPGN